MIRVQVRLLLLVLVAIAGLMLGAWLMLSPTSVAAQPNVITISKEIDDETPVTGQTVTFTVRIQGTDVTASNNNILFLDRLMGGWQYVDGGYTCTATVGTCRNEPFVIGPTLTQELRAGSTDGGDLNDWDFTITYQVFIEQPGGTVLSNHACYATETPSSCGPSNPFDEVQVVVAEEGSFGQIAKEASGTDFAPGDSLTYTITLPWTGGAVSEGAVPFTIEDILPGTETIDDVRCSGTNATCTTEIDDITVTASGSINDGTQDATITFEIDVTINASTPTSTLINSVCQTEIEGENCTTSEIQVLRAGEFLPLTKTVTVSAAPRGGALQYRVTLNWVGDVGSVGAEPFSLVDTMPAGFDLVNAACVGVTNATCDVPTPGSNTISTSGSVIDGTQNAEILLVINGTISNDAPGGTITNTACLVETDNCDSADVLVLVSGFPGQVSKTADVSEVSPGDVVTYTVSLPYVAGTDPDGIIELTIIDNVPDTLTDVSWACTNLVNMTCVGGDTGNGNAVDQSARPDDPTLAGTFEITVTGTVVADADPGVFTNTACAGAISGFRENPGIRAFAQGEENCASIDVTVIQLEPGSFGQITKVADVTEVERGDSVTYTIGLPFNAGTDPEADLGASITDPVPVILTDVTWTCGGINITCSVPNGSGNDIAVFLDVVDPTLDGSVTLTVTGTVVADAPAGPFTNTATYAVVASSSGILGFAAQPINEASATVTVIVPGETVTPEPPTVVPTEVPGTPIVTVTPEPPTVMPTDPAPTNPPTNPGQPSQPQPPVQALPNTGSGSGPDGFSVGFVLAALGLVLLATVTGVRRGRREQ